MKHLAFVALALFGCGNKDGKADDKAGSAAAPAPAPAPTAAPVAVPVPAPVEQVDACSLISADEVSAIFGGKKIIAKGSGKHACSYGLDPAESQAAMEKMQGDLMAAAKTGKMAMPSVPQLVVELEIAPSDNRSEDEVKKSLAVVGGAIDNTKVAAGSDHGLKETVVAGKEIPGIGDYAFTTNVASVNMGGALSVRGRLLEAKKGTWHMTVSVTISPDPGADKLDDQLASVAKTAAAKLK